MRPIRALTIYFIIVFFGGALLAPWLWHLGQLANHFEAFSSITAKIANAPFHRYLDRSFLFLALAGIWPLMRSLGTTSWREIGLPAPYGQINKILGGLLMGLLSLAFVVGIEIGAGARSFNHNATVPQIVGVIFSALISAVFVGLIEEILFRGAIYGGLRKALYWPFALILSSLIYALVHFLGRADIAGPVEWNSGLVVLPRLFDLRMFFPEFLGLTLVGILLALAYQRTGNLYFSIGMHAGWVFVLRMFASLTVQSPEISGAFWGSGKMIDSWLALLAISITLVIFQFLPLEKRPPYAIKG
jgi:membrane protease YdiL (CAAX protease family)